MEKQEQISKQNDAADNNSFVTLLNDSNERKHFMQYFYILLSIIFVLLLLSFFTTIDQTITVSGQVVPHNNIAVIKHETGGEVVDVLIEDYQLVYKGQPLLTLDNKKIITSLNQNRDKLKVVKTEILNSLLYLNKNKKYIKEKEILADVEQYFNELDDKLIESNKFSSASRIISDHKDEVYLEQIKQNNIEIARLKQDIKSLGNKLIHIDEQRKIYQELLSSKNVSKIMAIDYEVKYIDLQRDIEKASSDLDRHMRENKELESKRIVAEQDGIKEKYEELVKLNKEKIDLESNIEQLQDMLENSTIKSPIAGTVQGLKMIKGVKVQPGEEILTVIPFDSQLIFEAKADLMQKGKINFDNNTEVQFDGFNILEYNRISARIVKISPYTFDDEYSKDKFFKVLFKLDSNMIASKNKQYVVKPGMSGIAYVNSGKRSLFSYMFGPIYNSFYNAYNEK